VKYRYPLVRFYCRRITGLLIDLAQLSILSTVLASQEPRKLFALGLHISADKKDILLSKVDNKNIAENDINRPKKYGCI